jgi:hypothetical protein
MTLFRIAKVSTSQNLELYIPKLDKSWACLLKYSNIIQYIKIIVLYFSY